MHPTSIRVGKRPMQGTQNPLVAAAAGVALLVSALAYLVKRSDYDEIREEG
jgi:hypothetical protein